MFNIEEFYEKSHSGECQDTKSLTEYVNGFENVVLWGASFLGKEIGEKLLSFGSPVTAYWDIRADEIGSLLGRDVIKPFEGNYDKNNTLIVFCIGNNVTGPVLLNELIQKGYKNVLRGDFLYEGIGCPFDVNTGINPQTCQQSKMCNTTFCNRLANIVNKKSNRENGIKSGEPLNLFSVTFIINQRCTLGCKFCTSYMNSYSKEKKIDFSLERIEKDIDMFFDAIDSVAAITVMGGEPFLHHDIGLIIKKLLSKKNFGTAFIATSGIFKVDPDQLKYLKDPRIGVCFSNYTESLTPKHVEIFNKNLELLRANGISVKVPGQTPEWTIPSTLFDLHDSEDTMAAKKKSCKMPPRCMQIKNGKIHPCDFAGALYNLGVACYNDDYVDIANAVSAEQVRKDLRSFIDKPYYRSCGHCTGHNKLTAKAGEQGVIDYISR